VQGVKEAVNSAVDVMHTMTSSICNLLSKVCIYTLSSYRAAIYILFPLDFLLSRYINNKKSSIPNWKMLPNKILVHVFVFKQKFVFITNIMSLL
jgi:hypothetical protein